MPHIIVTAGDALETGSHVLLRERVSAADFESDHFATQLVERLGWAVGDATEAERTPDRVDYEDRRVDSREIGDHRGQRRSASVVTTAS
jgi:hypothetical protein